MRRALLLAALLPALGGGVIEGNRLYRAGQFRRAAEQYRRAYDAGDSSAATRYDLGTALLRLGRWDDARPQLEAAAEVKGQPELRQRALYNAGNADLEPVFRRGVTDADQRREHLLRAIGRYKDALLAAPGDVDAKWNLELAERLLAQQPPKSGGGGGGGNQQQQGGGGGGQNNPQQQAPQQGSNPLPTPVPQVSQEKADSILLGAAQAEQEAQRSVLSRLRTPRQAVRDW